MSRRRVREVLNSTGRLRILERDVSLTVIGDPPVVRVLRIDLPRPVGDVEAYERADVWFEATQPRTASFDRWRVSTVEKLRAKGGASQHLLRNFTDATDALFSLKVVAENGRILASSGEVRADERRLGEREALLQVRSAPLGELTWTLDIATDFQTFLVVNSRIPAAETWIESDPIASALVLPAALRALLSRLVADETFQESEWGRAWSEWATSMSPIERPATEERDDHDAWVEATVREFSRHHGLASRLVRARERQGEPV